MGSSSSSSDSSKAKNGEEVTFKIRFDPGDEESTVKCYDIKNSEWKDKLLNLCDDNQQSIIEVYAYKHKLLSLQLTSLMFNHSFIVFRTKDCWWSIEKNSEGISIQQSRDKRTVIQKYKGKSRNEPILMKKDEGRRTTAELTKWLHGNDELNYEYNWFYSNCQHFAQDVFNYVAKNVNLYYPFG
jgi:hypothetical protein